MGYLGIYLASWIPIEFKFPQRHLALPSLAPSTYLHLVRTLNILTRERLKSIFRYVRSRDCCTWADKQWGDGGTGGSQELKTQSSSKFYQNVANQVTAEAIQKCIDSLEDEQQKDFIRQCLVTDPASRPKARDLLFHPVLFEVQTSFS